MLPGINIITRIDFLAIAKQDLCHHQGFWLRTSQQERWVSGWLTVASKTPRITGNLSSSSSSSSSTGSSSSGPRTPCPALSSLGDPVSLTNCSEENAKDQLKLCYSKQNETIKKCRRAYRQLLFTSDKEEMGRRISGVGRHQITKRTTTFFNCSSSDCALFMFAFLCFD